MVKKWTPKQQDSVPNSSSPEVVMDPENDKVDLVDHVDNSWVQTEVTNISNKLPETPEQSVDEVGEAEVRDHQEIFLDLIDDLVSLKNI